jgi:hypothetical protein
VDARAFADADRSANAGIVPNLNPARTVFANPHGLTPAGGLYTDYSTVAGHITCTRADPIRRLVQTSLINEAALYNTGFDLRFDQAFAHDLAPRRASRDIGCSWSALVHGYALTGHTRVRHTGWAGWDDDAANARTRRKRGGGQAASSQDDRLD